MYVLHASSAFWRNMAAASLLPSLPDLPMSAARHNIFHCYCFVNRVEAATLSSSLPSRLACVRRKAENTLYWPRDKKDSPGLQITHDLAVMPDHSIPAPAGGVLFFTVAVSLLSRLLPRFLKRFQARFRVSNKLFKTRFRDFFLASYKFFQVRFRASFTLFTSFLRLVPRFFRAFSSLLCDLQFL